MVINHNMSAMFATRAEGLTEVSQQKDMEKLSSDMRINRARDDASTIIFSQYADISSKTIAFEITPISAAPMIVPPIPLVGKIFAKARWSECFLPLRVRNLAELSDVLPLCSRQALQTHLQR